MTVKPSFGAAVAALVSWCGAPTARALIFFDTGDEAHNLEVAPSGPWTGAGWQYQAYYKNFLGSMISPRHFITALHLGVGESTFVHKRFFSGEAQDRTYFINPTANGGAGRWIIEGTDLQVFEVWDEFPGYAPIYTKSDEAGKEAVMIGRGRTRGAEVAMMGETRGWRWGVRDFRVRWGVNDIDSVSESSSSGEMLVTDFDAAPGTEECHAALGDSGGAVFLRDGGTWKLAGIMSAVDGRYDTNATCGDGSDFDAAMFDASGFFVGEDSGQCDQWEPVSVTEDEDESRTYSSRISASAGAIEAIIQSAIDDAARTPEERFDHWMAGFAVASEVQPDEDADGDRTPNAVEYLASLHPGAVDGPKRAFEVVEWGNKLRFVVRVRLDAGARGLSWEICVSETLAADGFVPVSGLSQVAVTRLLNEGVEVIEFEIDKPSGPRGFYRLEVTLGS